MKGPERLVGSDPELARLMAMLDRDGPPEGAAERATKRAVAELAIVAGTASVAHASPLRLSTKLSIVAGLSAVAAIVIGVATSSQSSAVGSSTQPPAAVSANVRVESPIEAAPPPVQTLRVEDLPTARPSAVASAKVPSGDPFLEELAMVERARTALAQRRGAECLDIVAGYEKRFKGSGVFGEELEVMHIEALAMSGDRAQARARASQFAIDHRGSPYAERVKRVLDQSGE